MHPLCKNAYGLVHIHWHIYIHIHMYIYICIHAYIYTYIHIPCIYAWIYIYIHMHIYVHIHICIYICICTHVYIYLHNSCMRACATVQQLPCHGSYCELILSLARTSCRLSFPPALLPFVEPAALLLARCHTCLLRNVSKSTLAHDAVAAVVLHTHHLIIRVGASLIQFVNGSHSRMAADLTLDKNLFSQPFLRVL